jgi:hypothetical protein
MVRLTRWEYPPTGIVPGAEGALCRVPETNDFGTLIGRAELSPGMDLRSLMAPRGSEGADRGFHRGLRDGYHFTCFSSSPGHVLLDPLGSLVVHRCPTCGTNASQS